MLVGSEFEGKSHVLEGMRTVGRQEWELGFS